MLQSYRISSDKINTFENISRNLFLATISKQRNEHIIMKNSANTPFNQQIKQILKSLIHRCETSSSNFLNTFKIIHENSHQISVLNIDPWIMDYRALYWIQYFSCFYTQSAAFLPSFPSPGVVGFPFSSGIAFWLVAFGIPPLGEFTIEARFSISLPEIHVKST